MKNNVRKIFEGLIFALIVVASIVIFVYRDKINNLGIESYAGLLLLCFLANSTVLLPAPSLMIVASCALVMNPWWVAVFAAIGSSLGEFVGYAFGAVSKEIAPRFKQCLDRIFLKVKSRPLLVFILALLPLPLFDVVGIYSGGTRMNPLVFFLACFLGKFLKLLIYIQFVVIALQNM